jgi:hypothetical protein
VFPDFTIAAWFDISAGVAYNFFSNVTSAAPAWPSGAIVEGRGE